MEAVWELGQRAALQYPPLQDRLEVDVAVIGGGITGLSTALRLQEAGQQVAVLEAIRAGGGNTGGSTGNLYGTLSQGLDIVRRKWDEEVVRQVVDWRMQALDDIEETVRRFGIDCQFARRPLHFCVRDGASEKADMVAAEYTASQQAGLEARLMDSVPELPFPVHRALRIEQQAQFNPLRYAQGLAQAIQARGGHIHEQSPVTDVDAARGLVRTAGGEIQARHIVHATHTPKGINLLQAEMTPYREYGISARLAGNAYPEGTFWILDESLSLRSHHHDGHAYLVVVGEKHKTGHSTQGGRHFDHLHDAARAHFSVVDFEHHWSAQQYKPADQLPYIGRSGHDNVHVATGFAADGLTWGVVAARILTDQILGRDHAAAELFNPRRFTPGKSAKQWLKENIQVAGHYVKGYLAPAQRGSLADVAPGEGRLLKLGKEELAVYRAPDERLYACSPICPHMQCKVQWNAAEATWDCPCHGSRFQPDGRVIEGPAYQPLTRSDPSEWREQDERT